MADVFDPAKRSQIMSHVKSKNTAPEIKLRSILHRAGFRFRVNRKDLPGKPDIVLPKYKTVIFVNGCFWHGHDCKRGQRPQANTELWNEKINKVARGFMIESYLEDGRQDAPDVYGKSITDPCLGWDKTEELIREIHDTLSK